MEIDDGLQRTLEVHVSEKVADVSMHALRRANMGSMTTDDECNCLPISSTRLLPAALGV